MSKQLQEVYIVAAVRTPVGKAPRGVLRLSRPDDLLVHVLNNALAKVPSLDPKLVEDVIVGCAFPESEQGLNMARMAVLLAGLPETIGGVTVNRYCASGLTAIAMAADRIRVGQADVMIAAGAESMSMVPMMGNKPALNRLAVQDDNVGMAYGMGMTAEKVASQWKISRDAQDEFSLKSHQKAIAAQQSGAFDAEIAPFTVSQDLPDLASHKVAHINKVITQDEGPRADSSPEGLAKLKPVFAAKGSVTAGNSSQMSDGAAALILVSEKILKQFNLVPLAKFSSFAVKGVPPDIMGIGPKVAIPLALQHAGITQNDLAWIELNEAFAAQSLAVMQDLNLNPDVVNPLGGAIALGHPLGATGAIRAATLIHGLQRTQQKYGMVTMCVGAGMGAAGVFERV